MANLFLSGAVTVVVSGPEASLFPGRLHECGAVLVHIHYEKEDIIRFQMPVRHLGLLRKEARHFKGKVRLEKGTGLPFLLRRMIENYTFLLCSICFFFIIVLLSAMIIRIDVTGADVQTEKQIRAFLKKEGIREGAIRFERVNEQELSQNILLHVPNVTRFSLKKSGVVYKADVSLSKQQKETASDRRHLYASKAGVIHDLFVEYGETKARRGEFVEKGERLIKGSKKHPARGTVTAETWYKVTVTAGNDKLLTRSGKKRLNVYVSLGDKEYVLWKPSSLRKPFQSEEHRYELHFFSYTLPFSILTVTDYEVEKINTVETEEEMQRRAIQTARTAMMMRLPEKARIQGENVLQKRVDNGKVKMIIHFQVLENIAN
ncbi:sporulation protein YqfD [Domibacillus epiphyticus]|uniref:Sporulation protein YqfD n=1 Tax=Domibacillus epiphyticus TaxID=1714355 RepID=A0A1V2A9F5_9BACI|nr:sporulation protein YqfD [Domibacillus epiphyticus]OMP67639.1 hypothetical protein BTO28_06770 [Domibacillus epiphyticus]